MQINKSNSRILSNENKITTMSEQLQNLNTKIVERDTNIQIHDHAVTKYYTSSSGKVHYFHSFVWLSFV